MKTKSLVATLVAIAATVLLAACSGGLKGTFEDDMGVTSLTFQGGGKVVQATPLAAMEVEMQYEIDGDDVRITHPQVQGQALVLTRIDDDTLSGPMGIRYRRKK